MLGKSPSNIFEFKQIATSNFHFKKIGPNLTVVFNFTLEFKSNYTVPERKTKYSDSS